jgi:hypothetical protein
MMTDVSRRKQIEKALAARDELPQTERRTHPLQWRGGERFFPLIDLPVDVPLLNADSHRIRADLEAPEYDFVRKERTTDQAQQALVGLWKRAHRKFEKLKESLSVEGQTEPGVVTREAVLINGNTRLVALRELGKQWIRVAVLDSDARPFELADLELRLQVRETGHDPYRLSDVLLFIEEMSQQYGKTDEEIARALNWSPARPAMGKRAVGLHRRLLQLIRELQRRDPAVPITFFDDEGRGTGKLQQLKELELKYADYVATGEIDRAGLLLDTWLVVARSGFASVHQIRAVIQSDDFLGEFLLPRLGEQELFGERVESLVQNAAQPAADLPGIGDLDPAEGAVDGPESHDLKKLLTLVESEDESDVSLPGPETAQVEGAAVKYAIRLAVDGAIRDQRIEDRAEDALNAPVDSMRKAVRELKNALEAFANLKGTRDFERDVRGAFDYQFRHLKKHVRTLEDLIAGKEKDKAGR